MFLSVILLSVLFVPDVRQSSSVSVIKKNGDLVVLKELKILQGNGVVSDTALVCTRDGKEMKQAFGTLRRLNLKENLQKKKGVVTWDAVLVKADNEKLEIQVQIARVTGVNEQGNFVKISGGSIDKIVF